MTRISMVLLGIFALTASSGSAPSAEKALPEDENAIQSCLEGIRDFNASSSDEFASGDECIGTVAEPCLEDPQGQTTAGMIGCYGREIAVWDGLLNTNYTALQESLDEPAFEALRDTQRAWIAYRDSKCEWPYVFFQGGTIAGPVGSACMNEATARRANELAEYLNWTQN